MNGVVDIDDMATWPAPVFEHVLRRSKQLKGCTEYASDLPVRADEDAFRALLEGRLVRAYHCTRLLDHEVALVRSQGLRQLTRALVTERINEAHASRKLSDAERHALLQGHVFAMGEQAYRENQVCLILSRTTFDEQPWGCDPLLTTWGGEGIYMSSGTHKLSGRLKTLGRPAIVVARIDLSAPHAVHRVYPGVFNSFLGVAMGLTRLGSDVFYRQAVPPEAVEAIWQPGDPEYDRHSELART